MNNMKQLVLAALCTVFMIIGSYIVIPVGVVPIILGNMFVILAGLLLGPVWGAISVAAYLALGAVGLPVFAGGKGGFVHFIGPTGGYLVSYLPAVVICGYISCKEKFGKLTDVIAVVLGFVIIFLVGVPWLKLSIQAGWMKALSVGLFPFIPGEILKAIAAVVLSRAVRPVMEKIDAGRNA